MSPDVRFVVAHDTGNKGSTASANVHYYATSCNQQSASAHIFVDDKEIIECIPALTAPPEKAWHVLYSVPTDNQMFGCNANDAAIGVEYCFGDNIDADEAYRKYIWVISHACFKYSLDPAKMIIGHFILDPKRKTDPVTGLAHSRRTYDQLLRDVVQEFNECTGKAPVNGPKEVKSKHGKVMTTVRLNIRSSRPSMRALVAKVVPPGTELSFKGQAEGDPINGNALWYQDVDGNFFWSGGVKPVG